ncbi:MAG: hypothetical protein K6A41_08375 [Bacteroidales bacterium]|nr:hypothetical protein [Bacteroidales bacterium]
MKRIRQYIGIIVALLAYYLIHEGAHWLYALTHGVFKKVNFMALGVQIDIYRDQLTDAQLGWFCLAGPIATFIAAWIMVLLSKRICMAFGVNSTSHKPILLACSWYVSIILLLLDPLYLSVIYRFVGGGDMNGIKLIVPEMVAAIVFGVIFVLHMVVLWMWLLPRYKKAFNN